MAGRQRGWVAVREHYIENTLIYPRTLAHMHKLNTKPSDYDGYRTGPIVFHLGDYTHRFRYPRYTLHDQCWGKDVMDVFSYPDALVCPECLVVSCDFLVTVGHDGT